MTKTFYCLAVALICSFTFAQDNSANQSSKDFRLDAGYTRLYNGPRDHALYYKLEYRGQLMKQFGQAPEFASIGDRPLPPNVAGDGDDFILSIERDRGTLAGSLFDALGLKDIHLHSSFLSDFNVLVQVAGKMGSGGHTNAAFGLETKPLHPLRQTLFPVSNYLMIGAIGQAHSPTEGDDSGLLTYRSFVGKAFGHVVSAAQEEEYRSLVVDVTAGKYKFEDRQSLSLQTTGIGPVIFAMLADEPVVGPLTAANWDERLRSALVDYFYTKNSPTVALWLESDGRYRFTTGPDRKFASVWAFTFNFWPVPDRPDQMRIQVRYENGFTRADPTTRTNDVILSLGFSF